MVGDVLEYEIVNWARFNPPLKRTKSRNWFRINASIIDDPDVIQMGAGGLATVLVLLARACERDGKCRELVASMQRRCASRTREVLERNLRSLQDAGIIRFEILPATKLSARQDETRQDKTRQDLTPFNSPAVEVEASPPASAPELEEKKIRKMAIALADGFVGQFRAHADNEGAVFEVVGEIGAAAIRHRWVTWRAFCIEIKNAYSAGKESYFTHQLRESIEAFLYLRSVRATEEPKQPVLRVVALQSTRKRNETFQNRAN